MNNANVLTIGSLFYIILLMIVYFSKARIKNEENKMFSGLLVCNFVGLILAILCYLSVANYDKVPVINYIISRLYLAYLVTFIFMFSTYLLVIISTKNKRKILRKLTIISIIIEVFITALLFVLPLYFNNVDGVYSYGPGANVVYVLATFCMVAWVIIILINRKKGLIKKLLPIMILISGALITTIIQKINPALQLMTSMESFVIFLMYFTIENPDVKILNELYKNKELMEQNYEDKYNFLFEITQEARNPIVSINSVCNELRNEKVSEDIKEKIDNLYNLTRQLDFSINNVLNISSLDVQKIKVVNNKYDLEKICKDLETKIKSDIKADVKFNLSLPKYVPPLYGDYMKIRQILYSLLINACKNTSSGNISLKVNLIEKYDVCRIIFNISDTGSGMPIEKVNEIISATGELDKEEIDNLEQREYNVKVCQKVAKIMGGNLMIRSNIGKGTEVILTIDQRVYHENEKTVLAQYEDDISNYRKVLIVAQDKELINVIRKKLNMHNITCSVLYYGKDGIDKIKSGKKYDFIIVSDEMKEMTGFMTLKGMQEIKGFNTPTIVLLKEDKEHIKKHFLSDGFSDYILISSIDSELNRIIEKY